MTSDAQRIAIHVALGRCRAKDVHNVTGRGLVYCVITERGTEEREVPIYDRDLNAVHDAEKVQDDAQQEEFLLHLGKCVDPGLDDLQHDWNVVHASAAQRCEAFLKTLNLWDDSK